MLLNCIFICAFFIGYQKSTLGQLASLEQYIDLRVEIKGWADERLTLHVTYCTEDCDSVAVYSSLLDDISHAW